MKKGLLVLAVMLGIMPHTNAVRAQGMTGQGDSLVVIQLENTKIHKQVTLRIGQHIRYLLRKGKTFESGTIAGASDSTISLTIKNGHSVSLRYADIKTFKIQKGKDSRTGGTVLMVIGGLGTVAGLVAAGSGSSSDASGLGSAISTAGIITGVIALPMLIGGIALKSDKKLDMVNGWTPHVSRITGDVVPEAAMEREKVQGVKPSPASESNLRLKLGLGYGITSSTGAFLATIEPGLQVNRDVILGLRIEGVLPNGGDNNFKGISTTLNFQYFLTQNNFRPYLGFGAGMFAFGDAAFGFYPRLGFDAGHFFMMVEYNIRSVTQPPTFVAPIGSSTPTPSIPEEVSKYIGFRLGFTLGGPKR